MLASLLLGSFVPLAIAGGGGGESPFIFIAFWSLGVVSGCLVYLVVAHPGLMLNGEVLGAAARRLWCVSMLGSVGNALTFTFFSLSTRFVDPAVSTVLVETWPVMFILLMLMRFEGRRRYRGNACRVVPLVVLALSGFALVVLSQGGGFGLEGRDGWSFDLVWGVCLGVVAGVAGGVGLFYTFSWGEALAGELPPGVAGNHGAVSVALFCNLLGFGVGYLGGGLVNLLVGLTPVNAVFGLPLGETLGVTRAVFPGGTVSVVVPVVALAALGGFLFNSGSSILVRASNLVTDNLGVNALVYLGPVLSILWLALFLGVGVFRVDCLLAGVAAIVVANLLVHLEAVRPAAR